MKANKKLFSHKEKNKLSTGWSESLYTPPPLNNILFYFRLLLGLQGVGGEETFGQSCTLKLISQHFIFTEER